MRQIKTALHAIVSKQRVILSAMSMGLALAALANTSEVLADDGPKVSAQFVTSAAVGYTGSTLSEESLIWPVKLGPETSESKGTSTSRGNEQIDLDLTILVLETTWESKTSTRADEGRVSQIGSCYNAALGRYYAEQHRAVETGLSGHAHLDLAIEQRRAKRASEVQFSRCVAAK